MRIGKGGPAGQARSDIFDEEGLGFSAAMAIANLGGDASQLKTLRPGEKLSLRKTDDDALDELNYEIDDTHRSEEHTSELQSLMRISYAVFCLKKKNR